MYEKEIQELKNKIENPILKTHVAARICKNEDCQKYNKVQITSHYICPYCSMGLDLIEK